MSDNKEQEPKKVLSLSGRGKLELKRAPDSTSQVRQSFSHGRSKAVTVEVKTQRVRAPLTLSTPVAAEPVARQEPDQAPRRPEAAPAVRAGLQPRQLTAEEREVRNRALMFAAQEEKRRPSDPEPVTVDEPQPELEEAAASLGVAAWTNHSSRRAHRSGTSAGEPSCLPS